MTQSSAKARKDRAGLGYEAELHSADPSQEQTGTQSPLVASDSAELGWDLGGSF